MYWVKGIFCQLFFWYLQLQDNVALDVQEELNELPSTEVFFDLSSIPSDSKGSRGGWEVQGAGLGGECDIDLWNNFIDPMYEAVDRTDFTRKLQSFLQKVLPDGDLRAKSCFTFIPAKGNDKAVTEFLKCDEGTKKCICNDEEPFRMDSIPVGGKCVDEPAEVGTPCDRTRSDLLNRMFYHEFREGFANAKSEKEVAEVWRHLGLGFKKYLDEEALESDRRRACFNYKPSSIFNPQNLECSAAGMCECFDGDTLFSYDEEDPEGGMEETQRCLALEGAICQFQVSTMMLSNVTCHDNSTECQEVKRHPKIRLTICGGGKDTDDAAHFTNNFLLLLFPLFLLSIVSLWFP